ncbi:putative bifunctional diguanylate cyclase/phosphodiesterase [Rhodoferax sp. WC2427]|uniref:putative bifunctional diguanylate cyclase/phosphodiesterase n=1 Tax=Rhodoferax sp. WC2427 TaxID=3234144 RepID=UPI003465AB04
MRSSTHTHPVQHALGWILLFLALPLLWWVSHAEHSIAIEPMRFLYWHTCLELFAVVVAMLVFMTGYRAVFSARRGAVVLLGLAFLGVGLLDFLHTMSYGGMPDAITVNSAQKSMFFWLAARLLAALALLVYVLAPEGPDLPVGTKRRVLAGVLLLVGMLAYVGLLFPDAVPALFVPHQGLTGWKIGLEWLVITLDALTLLALWLRRSALANECAMALAFAVALSAASELFFTRLGTNDKDLANAVGHLYKIGAYLYLFHATFNESLRRPLDRLQMQHMREKLVLSAAPDGILWVDGAGRILLANQAMAQLSGYRSEELVGQNVDIFLPAHLRARHAESMRGYFMAPHPRAMGQMNLKLMRRDGTMLPVDISLGHWKDHGADHAIAYIRDLTERKKFEESLRHQATHDELTGLPNRWLFRLQLDQALVRAGRIGQRVAVLFLDLDYFKTINDSFGHAAGDVLLVQVGVRMRSVLRNNDTLARLGGDEFAIFLADLTEVDEAVTVANKLLVALQAAYCLQDQVVYSGGSLGLAFYPDDALDSDNLLRYADLAMYQAKHAGRGTYACYSQEMDRRVHEDMQLHTRLKEAMAQGALELHYQPQVDILSGAIAGAEALLRWQDPVLGPVSPVTFIPVAEATGLILPLSDWVLETACSQIAAWCLAGTPLRVAVNVSAQQFRQRDLPEKVRSVLQRTGAPAHLLDIEITESMAMSRPEQAREQLEALVALGCSVALDDFGTGYSSLAYLKALPVSKLKIDKSFMDGIPHDSNDVTISRAIIALAKSLGLTLVAEGVETHAQLDFLRAYGCEAYQGWLFAKAMPASALSALLRNLALDAVAAPESPTFNHAR